MLENAPVVLFFTLVVINLVALAYHACIAVREHRREREHRKHCDRMAAWQQAYSGRAA